jgi:hypothetical protein
VFTQRTACDNTNTSNALLVLVDYAAKATAWTNSHRPNTRPACKNVESRSMAPHELRRELHEVGSSEHITGDSQCPMLTLIHRCTVLRSSVFHGAKHSQKTMAHSSAVEAVGRPAPFSADRGARPPSISALCRSWVRSVGAADVSDNYLSMVSSGAPRARGVAATPEV